MGGLCQISHAFAEVARAEGAEIHTSSPVARVLLDGRRACGIELADGEKSTVMMSLSTPTSAMP
jgi:phytoene desaturase